MARIINLLIIIFELIALSKSLKRQTIKESLVFYTQISNFITLVSSVLFVIFGQKNYVEVIRFLGVCMLIMTFFVTACILVPITKDVKGLLFSGSGLFHHLIVPIVSTCSYMFLEKRVGIKWIWLPVVVTLVYGLIMLYLNYIGKVEGPYPFFYIKQMGTKLTVIWMVCLMIVMSVISLLVGFHKPLKSDVKYIFVHGLSGWGSYDIQNEFFPYWGLSGGDIIRFLNEQGYESYAASVDPKGSAWDRACELYAQLSGTKVDYGAVHSAEAGHERFGKDYSKNPLIDDFSNSEYVLIGHSFGGATIRLFSEILRNGSEAEIQGTDPEDISNFFKGGSGDGIVAIVTLAAPTNGTTAYDLYEDLSFDLTSVEMPQEYIEKSEIMSNVSKPEYDGRQLWDYASFDMHIDNALALNDTITTFDDVYYFAYPFISTTENSEGLIEPDPEITETMFLKNATYMSRYVGTTTGGFVVDDSWRPNDGLVNTVSAGAPLGEAMTNYMEGQALLPGIWNVMPTITGDHMSPQGGMTKRVNIKPFYLKMAGMLAELYSVRSDGC